METESEEKRRGQEGLKDHRVAGMGGGKTLLPPLEVGWGRGRSAVMKIKMGRGMPGVHTF